MRRIILSTLIACLVAVFMLMIWLHALSLWQKPAVPAEPPASETLEKAEADEAEMLAEPRPLPDVCEFILYSYIDPGLYGEYLRDFTQRQGWVDVNNDGAPEYAALTADGTAHVTGIMLTQDGTILPELSMRHEADKDTFYLRGWGLRDQQWLNHRGTTYLLSMLAGSDRLTQYVWHFTPDYSGQKVCEFEIGKYVRAAHPTEEALAHFPQDTAGIPLNDLCRDVGKQQAQGYLQPQPMDGVDISAEARSESFILADMDNDGREEKLLLVHYASGAGAGCEGTFLLREEDMARFRQGTAEGLSDASKRFYAAQRVDFTGRHPMDCDRSANPRVLSSGGHVFLERGDLSAPLRHARELYHELWYFGKDEAFPLCRFDLAPNAKQVFP